MSDLLKYNDRRASLAVLIVTIAIFALVARDLSPYTPDDAYISYRYAENLAEGRGLTFNPSEQPVEGYSNFLWIQLGSFAHKAGLDLVYWMPRIGGFLGILNIVVLWWILRRRAFPALQTFLPLLLFALAAPFTLYAISGLETPLFSFLLLATILAVDYALTTGKILYYVSLAFICVLLALTRPEGLIAFPIIVLFLLYLSTTKKGAELSPTPVAGKLAVASALFVAALVIYHIWRVQYFNDLVPTTLLSKGGGGSSIVNAWLVNKAVYFTRQGNDVVPFGYYYLALILVAATGLSLSNSKTPAKATESLAFGLAVIYALVYASFVDWMPGMRYHAPLIGLLLIPGTHVQNSIFRDYARPLNGGNLLRFAAVVAAIIMISLSGIATLRIYAHQWESNAKKTVVPLSRWIRDVMPADSLIATSDVGIVPYYSGLRTLDIHPEALTDRYVAKNGFRKDYFFRRDPDIVMLHSRGLFDAKFRDGYSELVEDPRFSSTYRFLAVSRLGWTDDLSYWIYVRNNLEFSDAQIENFPHGIGNIRRVSR